MKLATIHHSSAPDLTPNPDGQLVVVNATATKVALVKNPEFSCLRLAIENWTKATPLLRQIEQELNAETHPDPLEIKNLTFMAPLPRTWAWFDASAFIQHVLLTRMARGAEPPKDLRSIPLMFQGHSDNFLGAKDEIRLLDQSHGMDFEAELAIVVDRVESETKSAQAESKILLFMMMNDISLRELIPRELETGFGFLQGKPQAAFAPFALTPDELGDSWKDGRIHLTMQVFRNSEKFGNPEAHEMHFSFSQLIEHAARTRPLSAGTIIGSGTVSNKDPSRGACCIVERRMREKMSSAITLTPYLGVGETVKIEMLKDGKSVFGAIEQKIVGGSNK